MVSGSLNNPFDIYRECFEIANALFVILDEQGAVTEINGTACELFGYAKKEILGKNWFDHFLPPELRQGVRDGFDNIMRGDIEVMTQFENVIRTRSGQTRLISWRNTYRRDENGRITGTISFGEDVTDTRRVALERDRLFNYSLDMLCVAGFDGYFKDVNPAWEKTLGWRPDELLSKPWLEFVHPDDLSATENALAELVEGQQVLMLTNRYRCRDGSYRWVSWNSFPLIDERMIIAVVRDVTEKKLISTQLIENRDHRYHSDKMEAIGRLAGGVAHDFNNQLASIVGCADLLQEALSDKPQLHRYTEIILAASDHAAKLTNQLLAFARKGKYRIVSVELHAIIDDVVREVVTDGPPSIEVRLALDAENQMVTGDPTQLKNALLNVAMNAREAMPEGGELTIRTRNVALTTNDCYRLGIMAPAGGFLIIEVTDSGVGMDSDTMNHIFEPFFTTKGTGRGTGLGLASVYGTLINHEGGIHVISSPGKGSCFTIYLPLPEMQQTDAVSEPGAVAPDSSRGTVLLVDDEQTVLEAVDMMLKSFQLNVIACQNGADALDAMQARPDVDLVILDLVMPEWSGMKTYEEIRKVNPEVKVLLSSGYSLDEEAQHLLDVGVSGFLKKPFRKRELLIAIEPLIA